MDNKLISVDKIEAIRCADLDEAETTICVERKGNTAQIYTSDNVMLTKLKKQMVKNPEWKCWEAGRNTDNKVTGYFFEVPRRSVSIRAGNKIEVSDERREAAAKRFANMNVKRGRKKNGQS